VKKIKLVVSDFHLGNGRYLLDGKVNPLEDFQYDEEFIDFLEYHGAEQADEPRDLELIINGDFFNMIQLLDEEQAQGILTEQAALAKVEAIMNGHRELFAALREFNARDHRRVVFVLGNHDPQLLWKGVQEAIRRTVQGEVVFVEDAYRFDGVHIEHGHQLEPIFQMDPERYFLTRGYPEPVLNLPWGVFFVKDYLYRIKRRRPFVDKVAPYGLYWRWCMFNDFWFGLVAFFSYLWFVLRTRFSKLPLKRAGALKGIGAIFSLAHSPTMAEEAAAIMEREDCHTVILGHTHSPVHVKVGPGEYLNPGAWNDITHLDIPNLGHGRRLHYVRLEFSQGRPQARLCEWIGLQRPFRVLR